MVRQLIFDHSWSDDLFKRTIGRISPGEQCQVVDREDVSIGSVIAASMPKEDVVEEVIDDVAETVAKPAFERSSEASRLEQFEISRLPR